MHEKNDSLKTDIDEKSIKYARIFLYTDSRHKKSVAKHGLVAGWAHGERMKPLKGIDEKSREKAKKYPIFNARQPSIDFKASFWRVFLNENVLNVPRWPLTLFSINLAYIFNLHFDGVSKACIDEKSREKAKKYLTLPISISHPSISKGPFSVFFQRKMYSMTSARYYQKTPNQSHTCLDKKSKEKPQKYLISHVY
jgi:hypothetical protein